MTAIPEKIAQMIEPQADPKKKMLIAQGAFPLAPNVQILALGKLLDDPDIEIRKTSQKTIMDMPDSILIPLIPQIDNPKTLHILTLAKKDQTNILEAILLSKFCSPQTVEKIALEANQSICTMIVNNQVRLLKHPAIAESLRKNENVLQSDIERMISFLRMNGVVLEGESSELTLDEIEKILSMPDEDLPEDLIKEMEKPPSDEERLSLYRLIQDMSIAQKIKTALKGNKEARSMLVKDSNKLVACAVIKNPRVTDPEVLNMCQNRSIQEEILRIICLKPDWVRHYPVQVALCNNPKTPFQHALRFMKSLNTNDLKKLSKNKNAAAQLQKMAKVHYQQKQR